VFQEDDKADNEVLQPLIQAIAVYPLSEFDGKVKTRDWSSLPSLPWIKLGEEEWKWSIPQLSSTFCRSARRRPPASR